MEPREGEIFKELHTSFDTTGYLISNQGRLYSEKVKRFLSLKPNNSGYIRTGIIKNDGKRIIKALHEMVIVTFVSLRPENLFIDHIDCNKQNNNIENLRYVTVSENLRNIIFKKVETVNEDQDFTNEQWKKITINNQEIMASSYGRVKLKRKTTFGCKLQTGYFNCKINSKVFFVHRIICEAFHGKSPNIDDVVNHKDENPSNNHSDNLEWLTRKENIQYSKCKVVLQYSLNGDIIQEFPNSSSASETLNIPKDCIRHCCKGLYKHAGGFIWKYKDEKKNIECVFSNPKPVNQYDLKDNFIKKFPSATIAAKETGINHIGDVCNGRRKSAGKFKWKFD